MPKAKQKTKKPRTSPTGEKFAPKYGVAATQGYKGDPGPEKLRIPPPGHFLYDADSPTVFDEIKVRQIDADGHMTDPIEVWTDPDNSILWVIDGRDRLLAVREVNRRRAAERREPVEPYLKPLPKIMSEKEVVARISVKNFHRREHRVSSYAMHILAQRKAGWPWEAIAQHLHVKTEDPEQWCRKRLPLAFCEPEVREAFDAGEFRLAVARQFGGGAVDGEGAPNRQQQLALLEEKRQEKLAAKAVPKSKQVNPRARERIRHALSNGETQNLTHVDQMRAEGAAAVLAFVDGDEGALKAWPDVEAIVRGALRAKREEERA